MGIPKSYQNLKNLGSCSACASRPLPFRLVDDWTVSIGRRPCSGRSSRLLNVAISALSSRETAVIDDPDLEHAICADDNNLHALLDLFGQSSIARMLLWWNGRPRSLTWPARSSSALMAR